MARQRTIYAARRPLRALERTWTRLERLGDRLAAITPPARPYNPLYHLGTLTIFLLIVLTVTGVYLTVFYRPGSDQAYVSVLGISATWLGSLVRTVHRYSSGALILVAFLHALKVLLSDRFWGSRWLAWVSGWAMLVAFWIIGTMGYFLVWDQAAQWLTEYAIRLIRGAFALSFLEPESVSRTFSFFVIILFLHVFAPLMLVIGILIHGMRLTRTRYWSPRWLMIATVALAVGLAQLWPVSSNPPADLHNLVDSTLIDWWYLGFLPLIAYLGNPLVWGLSLPVLGVLLLLPWIGRGQHLGPAVIIEPRCTGCALCARECPYNAIEMVHRDDDTPYSSLAVIHPGLCTGCGVCVAACADVAVELEGLHSAVVRQDLHRALGHVMAQGDPPVVVYACDRHAALGTLPPLQPRSSTGTDDLDIPLLQARLPPRVNQGMWIDDEGVPHPVMTAIVPCMGMLHPTWAAEIIEAGAAGAIMITCPLDDCAFREGPYWVEHRMKRRRTLRRGNTHLLEIAPGSRAEVQALWSGMVAGGERAAETRQAPTAVRLETPKTETRPSLLASMRHLLPGLILLLLIFLIPMASWRPARMAFPAQAQLRVAIRHSGHLVAASDKLPPEVAAKLPDNVDPAMVLGGHRFPVRLRLRVDGEQILEREYRPRGLRSEGSSVGLESWWLPPGEHFVEIMLMDDGETWRTVFSQKVTIAPGRSLVLYYDDDQDTFFPVP